MHLSPRRRLSLRALPAFMRAAIPVLGVAWLGWPLASVLFYAWLELTLISLDTVILSLRERLAGNLFEVVLICGMVMMPVTMIAWYATLGLDWGERLDYLLGLLHGTSVRIAVALQVLIAIVYAIIRELEDEAEGWRFSAQLDLVQNRVLVLLVLALPLTGLFEASGIGMPGDGNTLANTVAVIAVAVVWLPSDLFPERFNRIVNAVLAATKRT